MHGQSKSSPVGQSTRCKFCTTSHELVRGACPARDKKCSNCRRKGHFAAKCFQLKDKAVRAVAVDDVDNQDEEECFTVFEVHAALKLDDDEQVTLKANGKMRVNTFVFRSILELSVM